MINDRWGKETRKSEGFVGYLTTEFDTKALDGTWEECRGMGYSFGYNQAETIDDYASGQAIVLMLVDVVSKGGNLLLDIGPDGRGNIPLIMQERLLQTGAWLETNGEAIYGTRKWRRPSQWSEEGRRDYKPDEDYVGSNYILKLTIDPEPGFGVKEVFFTEKSTEQGVFLYAISPRWPGSSLILRGVTAPAGADVVLLANGESLVWRQQGEDLLVELPDFGPDEFSSEQNYAYVFRIPQS